MPVFATGCRKVTRTYQHFGQVQDSQKNYAATTSWKKCARKRMEKLAVSMMYRYGIIDWSEREEIIS